MPVTIEGEVSYTGAVLGLFECNGYDDSDFYAIVWDEPTQSIKKVEYRSTRHAGSGKATVDAIPGFLIPAERILRDRYIDKMTRETEREARRPDMGRVVKSLTTRGKHKGAVGVVKWIGTDAYRSYPGRPVYRVGIQVDGETKLRYLPLDRVEVANPEPVNADEIAEIAKRKARRRVWRDAVSCYHDHA